MRYILAGLYTSPVDSQTKPADFEFYLADSGLKLAGLFKRISERKFKIATNRR